MLKVSNEQISLNLYLENLIDSYKSIIKKKNYKINYNKQRISKYHKKIIKAESFKIENEELRQLTYIETCKELINYCSNLIETEEKLKEDELMFLKSSICSALNDNICNEFISEEFFIIKDEYTIYNIPSAKLQFKSEIIIENEKLFKSYLFSNNFDYYNGEEIDFNSFLNDFNLFAANDMTIITESGEIISGLILKYDLDIIFID